MNDNQKTITYVAVAAVALVFAWEPWRPMPKEVVSEGEGQKLFPEFTDALAAADLEILQFDEATSTPREFRVAQVDGVWSIPSHSGYPADARDHMAAAATSLKDLEILGLVTSSPGEHELYGVIDPDPKTLKAGATGVGIRAIVKDAKDKTLADIVIGKTTKDDPQIRYVRRASQERVYTVKFSPDKLSTKFEDWIEKDLLKLSAFDVRQVQLNDYSVELGLAPNGQPAVLKNDRLRSTVAYEDEKEKPGWKLLELSEFEKGQPIAVELGEDEELNTEKLNTLKSSLADLKIVDVDRKPKGLSGNLKATADFVKNEEDYRSLQGKGFLPFPGEEEGQFDILSSEGEVLCRMKDGVEYILRFGRVKVGEGDASGDKADAENNDPDSADEKKSDSKDSKGLQLNRYLFVTARFNEDAIAKPTLAPLPEAGSADEGAKETSDENPTEGTNQCGPPKAAETKTPPAESSNTAKSDKDAAKSDKNAAAEKKADTKTNVKQPLDKPAPDGEKKAADAAGADTTAKETPDKVEEAKQAAEKRAAIEKENKRKQDEYDAKVKKGQDRVQELNERFADWYYVISDDVYKKIHLGRVDLVKKIEKPKGEGDSVEDFNTLEKGLKPKK